MRAVVRGLAAAALALMIWQGGMAPVLLIFLPTSIVAATIGMWLFYVQHQFEDTFWIRERGWNQHEAALYGSSHYDLPPILRWFTANIGMHHVHHLCSRIPYYRLPRVLRDHPAVAEVAVHAPFGVEGDASLVACIAFAADADAVSPQELATWCGRQLPSFMVPTGWAIVDRLPRTPSGKIDRSSLPVGGIMAGSSGAIEARDADEAELAAVLAEEEGEQSEADGRGVLGAVADEDERGDAPQG